jgi:hypothetical protein
LRKTLARTQLFVIIGIVLISTTSRALPEPATTQNQPIEVHLSQGGESDPLWFMVMDKLIWPSVVIVAVIIFRIPLSSLFKTLATKGGEFSVGGLALRFPELESKIAAQGEAISNQQGKIDEQSEKIRDLIKYSMSQYIFTMLTALKEAKASRGEYIYRTDGSMERNLRYLIDHGYVEEVPHWPVDGENISPLVKITPQGYDVIAIRTH